MSHAATKWAIEQRGLKAAAKIVLWHLCDRYHPDMGCFPSQARLAEDCEMSRSALNDNLNQLERAGLIAREQRVDPRTRQQKSTIYRFAFEPGFTPVAAENPCPEIGHGCDSEAVSGNQAEPCPENGNSRVRNPDTNLVREPVREPVTEREGASARAEGARGETAEPAEDDERQLLKRVKAMETGRGGKSWPGCEGSSTNWAVSQFAKLTAEERKQAEARRDAYLALCEAKKIRPVALGVYFRDRKFEGVTEATREARAAAKIKIAPLGPVWAGMKALALAAGPERISIPDNIQAEVRDAYEAMKRTSGAAAMRYLLNKGLREVDGQLIFPADFREQEIARRVRSHGYPEVNRLHDAGDQLVCEAKYAALAELCEAVPEGSDLYRAWRATYEAEGWPWKDCCVGKPGQRIAYFPKGGPEGFEAWVNAAKAAVDGGGAC